jgi:hypothetical protein
MLWQRFLKSIYKKRKDEVDIEPNTYSFAKMVRNMQKPSVIRGHVHSFRQIRFHTTYLVRQSRDLKQEPHRARGVSLLLYSPEFCCVGEILDFRAILSWNGTRILRVFEVNGLMFHRWFNPSCKRFREPPFRIQETEEIEARGDV